jgi:hypothetical protein
MGFSRPLQAKLMVVLSIILEQDLFETNFIGFAGVNFINILCTNFLNECLFRSFFYVHVTREKLPKQCLYKKFVRYMMMKLTTGVNFINILHTTFFYKNVLHSFSLVTVWLGIFWHKNISKKAAIKMLMNDEIDPWCHFNTILLANFWNESALSSFFLVIIGTKNSRVKCGMKLTTDFTNILRTAFSYENVLCLQIVLVILWAKGYWTKSCS